jgi:two-component system, LytTR family, response regulator
MKESFIILNTATGGFWVDPNTIVHIEASSNYSKLYFNDGKKLVTAKLLKWFEERLPRQDFTRLHRSHLVNNRFLQIQQSSGKAFELQNGKILEISRRRKKSVLLKLLPQPQALPSSNAGCLLS